MAAHPVLEHRAESLAKYGVRAMDVAIGTFECRDCTVEVPDPALRIIGSIAYRDLDSLIAFAVKLGGDIERFGPMCPTCGKRAFLERFDYHAFHSGAGRDLVVRYFPKPSVMARAHQELAWWTPGSDPVTIATLSAEQKDVIVRDAFLRAAQTDLEIHGIESAQAVAAIERALESIPGDPDLLRFVSPLLAAMQPALAGAICDAHTAVHPDDTAGHFGLANVVIHLVAHGAWGLERLDRAEASLDRVLQIDPKHLEARMARGTLMRLRGDDGPALDLYRKLLVNHADFGPLHYNIGSLLLARRDGAAALEHFVAGEALDLTDPDYPLGRARALAILGRPVEARAALERARLMAPDDANVAQVAKELG